MTWFDVYLFTKLDTLIKTFGFFSFIFGMYVFFIIGSLIAKKCCPNEDIPNLPFKKTVIVIFCTLFLLFTLTPSTKQFAVIYLLPKIANNKEVQKLPDNTVKLLNEQMEQWIEKLRKK